MEDSEDGDPDAEKSPSKVFVTDSIPNYYQKRPQIQSSLIRYISILGFAISIAFLFLTIGSPTNAPSEEIFLILLGIAAFTAVLILYRDKFPYLVERKL